jgi:hypothetical protein
MLFPQQLQQYRMQTQQYHKKQDPDYDGAQDDTHGPRAIDGYLFALREERGRGHGSGRLLALSVSIDSEAMTNWKVEGKRKRKTHIDTTSDPGHEEWGVWRVGTARERQTKCEILARAFHVIATACSDCAALHPRLRNDCVVDVVPTFGVVLFES